MQLHSEAISDGSTIELTYCEPQCGGSNVSPDLTWSGAPEGTKSYAVTCFDPDAPTGSGWWHWIAFDIATAQTSLSAGQGPDAPMRQWRNDYGYVGYGGPCPPPGPAHRYVFTVHALDVEKLDVPDEATSAACRFTLLSHAIDSASFTATFGLDD
ncbi:MAG: YbhB/YbcL family Raf kinase inhibitor-like protein [Micropruina glycogenica]|jgi:Raf kinase inhibitor-like YbhB/YbcL family protein|nr:YbhB/YbcL family Raf kinase inhibitor-like protein [Propionibacteriaceae bacterium]